MPWVTFGCRDILGVAVGIGANIKDENYFAQQSPKDGANSRPGRATKQECRQMEAPKRPRIELKGSRLPCKLLLGAGESAFAQLPKRHLAAHGFAVGLA
jgi:hypothetical protein